MPDYGSIISALKRYRLVIYNMAQFSTVNIDFGQMTKQPNNQKKLNPIQENESTQAQ